MNEDWEVITMYTLQDALEDGKLVEIFKDEWETLSKGKPIVATAAIVQDVLEPELSKMWNLFVMRRIIDLAVNVRSLLVAEYNGETVWVMEDGESITYIYPHEY